MDVFPDVFILTILKTQYAPELNKRETFKKMIPSPMHIQREFFSAAYAISVREKVSVFRLYAKYCKYYC